MINELLAENSTMDKGDGAGQGTYDHPVAQGNEGALGIVEAAEQGYALEQGTADEGGHLVDQGSHADVAHGYAGERNDAEEQARELQTRGFFCWSKGYMLI